MTAFRILRWGSDELPPAVCLHDVRGHARRFERVARMLERGRLVVAYDLRGHGRSPWSGPHTIEQHADDLHEVLVACGIDQAGLIGDGFGARVAIAYAVRNQERINSLTLLEPPLAPSPEAMLEAARVERDGGGYAGVDEAIDRRRQEDGLEAAAHPETRLADVLCPTMLIHGHESRWLTDGDVEAAFDAVRRLRVEEVPGGHVVLWDAMAETSALVRDFLVAKDRTA
jgi:pimeloyl-ACP methyl ester carboxylesterase